MIRPPRLQPGDRVSVVAPAGPVPRERFAAGARILGERYQLVHDERIFARAGFLAGDDAARQAELARALHDPTTRAVVCARGGYGLLRLDLSIVRDAPPKWVVGFSDITVLHAALTAQGRASIHGPVVTQLGALPAEDAAAVFSLLESEAPPAALTGLFTLHPGVAEGRLAGGNLELLSRLCGSPLAPSLADAVLLLEEVGERPYRIDRALTQLRRSGAFAGLRGVIVGELHRCVEPDGAGPSALEVVAERFAGLGVPVVAGAPVGHGARNRALALGAHARVDAASGTVEFTWS
jgi:muramoyltetrapeptide carboxypeptidase